MKHFLAFFYLLSMFSLSACSADIDINRLRVNDLDSPFGIDQMPRFSWVAKTQERGERQTAYEIEVLDEQGREVWNSGKVPSSDSYQIAYEGKELMSQSSYRWRVRIWDQDDQSTTWSAWHTFETAMLSPGDWKAQWIRADEMSEKEKAAQVAIVFDHPILSRNSWLSSIMMTVNLAVGESIAARERDVSVVSTSLAISGISISPLLFICRRS